MAHTSHSTSQLHIATKFQRLSEKQLSLSKFLLTDLDWLTIAGSKPTGATLISISDMAYYLVYSNFFLLRISAFLNESNLNLVCCTIIQVYTIVHLDNVREYYAFCQVKFETM